MTSAQILQKNQISLGGFYYQVNGPIQSFLSSKYARKIVIGPTDMDAHEDISYLRWDNWTDGIGLEEFFSAGGEAPKRIWFGDCNLSMDKHLTLGPLVTKTTSVEGTFPTANAGDDVPALAIFQDALYQVVRNTVSAADRIRVYKYNNGSDSWSTAVHVMPAGAVTFTRNVDIKVGFVNGVENLIVCAGSHYAFTTDGSSWTDSTKDTMRITFHDDSLLGIDRTGQLWLSTTLGTETNKAQLPVPADATTTDVAYISDLFTEPNAAGDVVVWAATAFGLFQYDQVNDKWIKSNITFPEARYNGRGTAIWNADLYVPAGMGLYRAIFGTETQVFRIGPDQDHGLPAINRGAIVDLAPGHDILAVCLEGDFPGFRHYVTTATDLRSLVMAYDGRGWQVLWQSTTASERAHKVIIGSAYDEYRLWFSTVVTSTARDVYFLDLSSERVNTHETQSQNYASSSQIETPWFKVGQDVEGLAISILIEMHDGSTNETVKLEYKTDYSDTYIDEGTIGGDVSFEFALPSTDDPTGVVFQAIRFRITCARGGTTTNRPFLHAITLKFFKIIPDRQTHVLTINTREHQAGISPRDQWRNLRTAMRNRELLEFTFRDDPALGSEDRFFVRINDFQSSMESGLDYGGDITLQLVEVQHIVGGMWDIDKWSQFQWG